jgi:hypothetical protein
MELFAVVVVVVAVVPFFCYPFFYPPLTNSYRASPIEELIVRGTCMQTVDIYYIDTLVITSLSLGEPPVAFVEILLERFFPPANKFPKDVVWSLSFVLSPFLPLHLPHAYSQENQFRLKALKLLRTYITKNYFHIDPLLQFTYAIH